MKKHTEFAGAPAMWEKFLFYGIPVITVPERMVGCDGCIAKDGTIRDSNRPGFTTCQVLPSCHDRSFIREDEFETPEMKVRLVEWRMGLNDED